MMDAPPKQIDSTARRLSRRDLLLLPLVVVATLLALIVPLELVGRALFPEAELDSCLPTTAASVFHGAPNCVSRTKAIEGPWAINRYNSCGYRTPEPCGPTPTGALRVAVIGASTSAGYLTPYEDTMAARAAATLARRCGRAVEFQNLSAAGNYGVRLKASAAEAVALQPDAVVMVISPIDFDKAEADQTHNAGTRPTWNPVRQIKDALAASRLLYMETYFFLRNDDVYVPMYLKSGQKPDFMRAPLPPPWPARLHAFDTLVGDIAAITGASGVKTVLMFMPQRAQAAVASSGGLVDDFDSELLPGAIGAIAQAHGMAFVDVTRAVARDTPSETLFYPINGHPNAGGHALMAESLVQRLLAPGMAPFGEACRF